MDKNCGKKKIKNPKPNTFQHLSVKEMKKLLKGVKNIEKMTRKELCLELLKLNSKKNLGNFTKKLIEKTKEKKSITEKHISKIALDNTLDNTLNNTSKPLNTDINLGYINYDGNNSCYIDSTFFSLFNTPNQWINKTFFRRKLPFSNIPALYSLVTEIRNVIKNLYLNLHTDKKNLTCSNLRKLFSEFEKTYNAIYKTIRKTNQTKWLTRQQEPSDVLNILMKIFDIRPDVEISITSKTTNRIEKTFFNSPIIDVGELKTHKIVYIKDYFPITNESFVLDNGTKYHKTTTLKTAPAILINISRNYLNIEKVTTPVIPEEKLDISGKILNCNSLLIHHGNNTKTGHYTCVFKYYKNNKWYHYDDLSNTYKYLGDFQDILRWNKGFVTKNVVCCFYI